MRPAVRLAALMKVPSIFVWTHDSVALGEDGPTHQPIEQLATLRAIPGFTSCAPPTPTRSPAPGSRSSKRRDGPAGIALTRQNIPVFERGDGDASGDTLASAANCRRAPTCSPRPPNGTPDVILIATGSEVQLAVEARETLEAEGVNARVVSAPSLEWFEEQSAEYRESVLPAAVTARVSVEAGIALTWQRYIGDRGRASRSSTSVRPPTTRPCSASSASRPKPSSPPPRNRSRRPDARLKRRHPQ